LAVLRATASSPDPYAPRANGTPGGTVPDGGVKAGLRAQLTSFVGREEELRQVGAELAAARLVTLVGPGGAGKTRLALEVAARAAGDRKSTRLNSSHVKISYAVFCLKKKNSKN